MRRPKIASSETYRPSCSYGRYIAQTFWIRIVSQSAWNGTFRPTNIGEIINERFHSEEMNVCQLNILHELTLVRQQHPNTNDRRPELFNGLKNLNNKKKLRKSLNALIPQYT